MARDGLSLAALERHLGHRFNDRTILERALTHRSAAHEAGTLSESNECLELLGDAILGFLVTDALHRAAPDREVGVLSRWRASLIGARSLTEVARAIDLGRYVRLGRGEDASGGRHKGSIVGDACEAVIGALYIDGGLAAAARFVQREWGPAVRRCLDEPSADQPDPKSALQQRLQQHGEPPPAYHVVEVSGPDHCRLFRVEVATAAGVLGVGEGPSKREAEQEAARRALQRL